MTRRQLPDYHSDASLAVEAPESTDARHLSTDAGGVALSGFAQTSRILSHANRPRNIEVLKSRGHALGKTFRSEIAPNHAADHVDESLGAEALRPFSPSRRSSGVILNLYVNETPKVFPSAFAASSTNSNFEECLRSKSLSTCGI